jgi:hypothetical protein
MQNILSVADQVFVSYNVALSPGLHTHALHRRSVLKCLTCDVCRQPDLDSRRVHRPDDPHLAGGVTLTQVMLWR